MRARRTFKRVCFDIETEAFSSAFQRAEDRKGRLKEAPQMRVACTFDGNEWCFFVPSEAASLIELLVSADELISFNGLHFDELVLRRHHGLNGAFPQRGKHVDLCDELRRRGVAFGAKRTSTGKPNRLDRSKMTPCVRFRVVRDSRRRTAQAPSRVRIRATNILRPEARGSA